MNVLVLTEGGGKLGLGHLSRCIALKQAITELLPTADFDFIADTDKQAQNFLRSQNTNSLSLDWLRHKSRIPHFLEKANVVIVDSYRAPVSFYRALGNPKYKRRPLVVAIDDYQRIDYPVDLVINPSIYGDSLNYAAESHNGMKFLLGKKYIILRKEFWNPAQKKIRKKIRDILITFGGTVDIKFAMGIVHFLSDKFSGINYHIIANVRGYTKKYSRCKIYSALSAQETRDLMASCDLCISAGGQTLYELIKVGIPTIGICFARNQYLNLRTAQKQNLVTFAGWSYHKGLSILIHTLIIGMDYKKRMSLSRRSRNCFAGNGAFQVAKEISRLSALDR